MIDYTEKRTVRKFVKLGKKMEFFERERNISIFFENNN